MELDEKKLKKVEIGARIRKIREIKFNETREQFATRCGLTVTHVGQIERGNILISLKALNKIACRTGEPIEKILYGIEETKKYNPIRRNLNNLLDLSTDAEVKVFYKCISSIKCHINEKI